MYAMRTPEQNYGREEKKYENKLQAMIKSFQFS